jgi:hypothetical protein
MMFTWIKLQHMDYKNYTPHENWGPANEDNKNERTDITEN